MKDEIIYNKLVRDRIPEITLASGWKSTTRVLGQKEFIQALKNKIVEESLELKEGKTDENLVEELADLQEIIDAILSEKKIKFTDFRKIQTEKRLKRGGFKKKLFLIKTEKTDGK